MDIYTKCIKDNVEIQLNKSIQDVSENDLLNIKLMTLDQIEYDGDVNLVDYDEIMYFKNLEELNVFNCMINEKLLNNILKLEKLKILNIYDSDFVDYINDSFSKMSLEKITFNNCLGVSINELINLKYLDIKNINIDFNINNVETLNISNSKNKLKELNLNNVKNIIISKNNYYNETDLFTFKSNIIIVDDKNEIIKEIKND